MLGLAARTPRPCKGAQPAMQGLYEESATRTGNGQPHKTKSKPKNTSPLAVHLGGLQNLLRLRTNYRFNEKLSGQVGADLNLQQQSVFPAGTLQYEIIAKDKHWGAIQATTTGLSYRKGISLQRKDASCKVTGKVGCTFQGRKEIGLDIGSIKPWQTVLVGALGLLALGKPVTGGRRFPDDLTLTLPGLKNPGLAQGEVNVTIQRSRNVRFGSPSFAACTAARS
ncbi:hypothetical protein WJX77_011400 [Trebouxia sp. C0004]